MRNPEVWGPTNIIQSKSGWMPNRNYVAPWSSHVTNLECSTYIGVLQEHARGDLLDVGAGTVPYYGVYRDQVKSVITLDWHNTNHDSPHTDILADANEGLPFNDQSFDTVLLADVIEHIRKPETLFLHVSRVLRDEGKAIIFVPFLYGIHEIPHDYYRYTKFALEDLCQRAGLEVHEIEAYGGGPDVVIDLMEKMAHSNKLARIITLLARSAIVKSKVYDLAREKYKERFPIGYTVVAHKPATVVE